jgi:GntR family transcriptional regulator
MMMHVSTRSGVPIYVQLISQIKHLIACGRLSTGSELPPIRTLAEQLLINPNTVARAYRELESAGLLTTRRGAGTYVSDKGSPLARGERVKILSEHIDGLLAEASSLGVEFEQLLELLNKRRAAMAHQSAPAR